MNIMRDYINGGYAIPGHKDSSDKVVYSYGQVTKLGYAVADPEDESGVDLDFTMKSKGHVIGDKLVFFGPIGVIYPLVRKEGAHPKHHETPYEVELEAAKAGHNYESKNTRHDPIFDGLIGNLFFGWFHK